MNHLTTADAKPLCTAIRHAKLLRCAFVLTIGFTCAWADSYTLSINGGTAHAINNFTLIGMHEFSFSIPVNGTTEAFVTELKTDQNQGKTLPSVVVDVYSGTSTLIAAYNFSDAFVMSVIFSPPGRGPEVTATVTIGYSRVTRITDQQVTSETTGPVSGYLTVSFPEGPTGPTCPRDVVSFAGNIHVVTTVNRMGGAVDFYLNLDSVKGEGTNGQYVGEGATSLLDQPLPSGARVIVFPANLHPPGPCQARFTALGALPLVVSIEFATDGIVSQVSAAVQVF